MWQEKYEPWSDNVYQLKTNNQGGRQTQEYWKSLFPSFSKATAIPELDPKIATPYAIGGLRDRPNEEMKLWTDFSSNVESMASEEGDESTVLFF